MQLKLKGLYQKRGWYYYGRMRKGVRAIVSLNTKYIHEAIQRAHILESKPELLAPEESRIEVKRFVAYKVKVNDYSGFSAENKEYTLMAFTRWLGKQKGIVITLGKVTRKHVQDFFNSEKARTTDSTAQGYLFTVKSFFNYLRDERKVVKENPVDGVDMGKWDYGTRIKCCTPEERDILLDTISGGVPEHVLPSETVRILSFVLLCGFELGLRKNEIIEARPDWIDLEKKSFRVQKTDTFVPKDRESRSVPMTDQLTTFLRQYKMTGQWCIKPMKQRGKSRYRYDLIRPFNIFLEYVSEKTGCDFTWVTPHVMRHTFASVLIHNGVSLTKVSIWMGDDMRTTRRHYAHIIEGDSEINELRTKR